MNTNEPKMSKFELYVSGLPIEIQDEARKIDEYLTKGMEKDFKLKRTIDKYGNVTYISPWGFRYKMRRIAAKELHDIMWINDKKEFYFIETFKKLGEKLPELSDKIFSDNVHTYVVGKICPKCKFPECKNAKTYEFNGRTKTTCGSAIQFEWTPSDFKNVKKVIDAIHEVIKATETSE